MQTKSGQISVNTENIFPIIRKWLYSDQDIFLREVVSNATDAISKYKRLLEFGEARAEGEEEFRIDVIYDSAAKTLQIIDNGIGMTAEEVEKYINQIAFSGAMDFVEKYKDKGDATGIIGHFGLGFYSVFMVSEHVTIDSLSYQEGAEAVRWQSSDGQEFSLSAGDKSSRGTCITLNFDQEAEKELTAEKLREILHKYCQFMPYPIYFSDVVGDKEAQDQREKSYQTRLESYEKRRKESLDKGEAFDESEPEKPQDFALHAINNTAPLWLKAPKDCTETEYLDFYKEAFNDYRKPLFWIHLNMDYPFRLQGILYFPQAENRYETLEGRIKLYNNQVFVADNIKEVIPEFLFLLKGVIDCPDLPLNVSRSFLQNDAYVKKLSEHIIRKVADKLTQLYKNEREAYNGYWKDISVFVKYGCLREEKFFERVKEALLFETVDGEFKTREELGETIYYVAEPEKQSVYIRHAKEQSRTVVILNHELDMPFIQMLEMKLSPVKFVRIDAAVEGKAATEEDVKFFEQLFRAALHDENLKVEVQALDEKALPTMIKESEESRRMQEMRKQFERMSGNGEGMDFDSLFPIEQTLIVNSAHPLIKKLQAAEAEETEKKPVYDAMLKQLYKLAQLGHGSLQADALADYVVDSVQLLEELL